MKLCTKLKDGCEHLCLHPCGALCDACCSVLVDNIALALRCGYEKNALLSWEYQDQTKVVCREMVKRTVPGCGHEVTIACHVDINYEDFSCFATCGDPLRCARACKSPCWKCNTCANGIISKSDHGKCKQPCNRRYSTCKHLCKAPCHSGEPCPLCTAKCDSRCSHARCTQPCSESVKGMQADLLMFTAYRDMDLDAGPCVFTSCGHIFTTNSLDGTMGMQNYCEIDLRTRKFTRLKLSPLPFSI